MLKKLDKKSYSYVQVHIIGLYQGSSHIAYNK